MAHSEEKREHDWYFDNGATYDVANGLIDLNIKTKFKGGEKLMIGRCRLIILTILGLFSLLSKV